MSSRHSEGEGGGEGDGSCGEGGGAELDNDLGTTGIGSGFASGLLFSSEDVDFITLVETVTISGGEFSSGLGLVGLRVGHVEEHGVVGDIGSGSAASPLVLVTSGADVGGASGGDLEGGGSLGVSGGVVGTS